MIYSIEALVAIVFGLIWLYKLRYFDDVRYSSIFFFFSYIYIFLGLILETQQYKANFFYIYIYFSLFLVIVFCSFDRKIPIKRDYKFFNSRIFIGLYFLAFLLFCVFLLQSVSNIGLGSIDGLEIDRLILVQEKKIVFYGLVIISPYLLVTILHEVGHRAWLLGLFLLMIVIFLSGFRSPMLNIVIVSFLYFALYDKSFIKRRFILILLVGFILFGFATYLTIQRVGTNLTEAFLILADRLLTLNLRNIDNIMVHHELNDYFYGQTAIMDSWPLIGRALAFLGAERGSTYAEYITLELNPNSINGFVMTPTFFGISYADLPFIGLILHLFIFGLILVLILKWVRYLPLQATFIYFFGITATRGLFTTLILFFVPILIVHCIIKFCAKMDSQHAGE